MMLVLTPGMLLVVSRQGGVVYFEDSLTCAVKLNGLMVHVKRIASDMWAVNSFSKDFFIKVMGDAKKCRTTFTCSEVELLRIFRKVALVNA